MLLNLKIILSKKIIHIIRHGETAYNKTGRIQGQGIDAPLNDKGKKQSAAFFQTYQTRKFDKIYVSALKRTKESVVHFLDKGVQYESLLGLNEISWGHHEGAVFTPEIKKNHFDVLDSWQKGDYERMAPGGESPNQVMARQREAIAYIMQQENESEILICMHGRAMRILLSWLLFDSLSKMESFKHSNMCRYQINYDGNNFSLAASNDTRHLAHISN